MCLDPHPSREIEDCANILSLSKEHRTISQHDFWFWAYLQHWLHSKCALKVISWFKRGPVGIREMPRFKYNLGIMPYYQHYVDSIFKPQPEKMITRQWICHIVRWIFFQLKSKPNFIGYWCSAILRLSRVITFWLPKGKTLLLFFQEL